MIGNLRKFASTKFAGILIGIIIIPFVFMGMGNIFQGGNTNNIVKINNESISTQDFMNYLNQSGLSQQVIKENIEKNVIEELLSSLVSMTLLELEIKDLDLIASEETIIKRLKKNKNFQDENGKFQRTLYEKFLLTNSMNAPMYEIKIKNNDLQKKLFTYISGGIKTPKFLTNKHFIENNRKLNINYIDLNNFYRKPDEFTNNEIKIFIKENSKELKQDFIDFSYAIIEPKNLIGLDEYNQDFFDRVDEIDNMVAKGLDFKTISDELNIKPVIKKNYINLEDKETIENLIYNSRKNKIEILEVNGKFIFYQIDNINTQLPSLSDDKYIKQIKNLLFQKGKFEFNKNILDKLDKKEFSNSSFEKLGIDKIKKIKLNSVKDSSKFEINSIKILYTLKNNSFTLVADKKNNIYIAKVLGYEDIDISENSKKINKISDEASTENRNRILKSYDYLLNSKYKVIVNEKTLDRVKNYFR